MSSDRYVATRSIRDAVKGRETKVLEALGIAWQEGAPHISCPYREHADGNTSWRWDERRARAYCSCIERSHSIFDVLSSASRRMSVTWVHRMLSRSESSVTAVLGCLLPRSRRRRHFGDDLGWHLNLGFFFLILRPVNFRPLRWFERILDDDGFSRGPARRLRHWVGRSLLSGVVARLGSYSH
jgi:hypothetical protein